MLQNTLGQVTLSLLMFSLSIASAGALLMWKYGTNTVYLSAIIESSYCSIRVPEFVRQFRDAGLQQITSKPLLSSVRFVPCESLQKKPESLSVNDLHAWISMDRIALGASFFTEAQRSGCYVMEKYLKGFPNDLASSYMFINQSFEIRNETNGVVNVCGAVRRTSKGILYTFFLIFPGSMAWVNSYSEIESIPASSDVIWEHMQQFLLNFSITHNVPASSGGRVEGGFGYIEIENTSLIHWVGGLLSVFIICLIVGFIYGRIWKRGFIGSPVHDQ